MKIYSGNIYKTPQFGMALRMSSKEKISSELGYEAMKQAESVRPKLEKIAKDVDIYIRPFNIKDFSGARHLGFAVTAKRRFKNQNPSFHNFRTPSLVYSSDNNLATDLIKAATLEREAEIRTI